MTGNLYRVTMEEFNKILNDEIRNFEYLENYIDLSYFGIEYLEILNSFSGFPQAQIGMILQGKNDLNTEEGYLGYSNIDEIKEIKISVLDNINEKDFISYLDRAEQENHLLGSYYSEKDENRPFILNYFNSIKTIYEQAERENEYLLYHIH